MTAPASAGAPFPERFNVRPSLVLAAVAALVLTGCRGGAGPLPDGAATATDGSRAAPAIVVRPSAVGAAVSGLVLGANMATWYDVTQPGLAQSFKTAGLN